MSEADGIEARVVENADGTIIVTLLEPLRIGAETFGRVTVRPLKGREARIFYAGGSFEDIGKMMDLGNLISDPPNAADEACCDADVAALLRAVTTQVGKYLGTGKSGRGSSGSSVPGSTSQPTSS